MIAIAELCASQVLTSGENQYDEDEEERRRQRLKQEKLNSAELISERTTAGMSDEEQKKNQSFTESLTTKVGFFIHNQIAIADLCGRSLTMFKSL